MTAPEAERIGLINHVVPADQLDEKVYGLARRLAGGAMQSIRWTKQTVNIPLRQLAHSMMDLSLSRETQFQGPPGSGMGLRPEAPAELHRPLSTIQACLLASGGIPGYSFEWNPTPGNRRRLN